MWAAVKNAVEEEEERRRRKVFSRSHFDGSVKDTTLLVRGMLVEIPIKNTHQKDTTLRERGMLEFLSSTR